MDVIALLNGVPKRCTARRATGSDQVSEYPLTKAKG
jgi:hypothetical protein